MKRFFILSAIALACAALGWITYLAAAPVPPLLPKYVPAGPLVYLEAKDFSTLLSDWTSSPQKKQWLTSDNYEVFSRSRLFLRLKSASDQFAAAAGLPPDMNFLSQVAGERSVFALYDIGNLQFLYITYLPSAKSVQTTLWQTRSNFEPRSAGGVNFYLRRDPQSQREVAFAVSGDYLLLSTREDLMAGALQLMAGKQDRTVEGEQWWAQATAAAGQAGDLRMVLNLEELVPNGYFRTYWVQQNITDLKQYSASVSDLFRSSKQYREERVLIRKEEPKQASSSDGVAAAAEVVRLVPGDAGVYEAEASPTSDTSFALLETKLLAPHLGPAPPPQAAPQVQLTSGEQGSGSDLEMRIDLAPAEGRAAQQSVSALKELLDKTPLLASLQVQSTTPDQAGVFVRIHSAVVLVAGTEWNQVSPPANSVSGGNKSRDARNLKACGRWSPRFAANTYWSATIPRWRKPSSQISAVSPTASLPICSPDSIISRSVPTLRASRTSSTGPTQLLSTPRTAEASRSSSPITWPASAQR